MENISRDNLVASGPDGSPQDQIRRYSVPAGLSPEEKRHGLSLGWGDCGVGIV